MTTLSLTHERARRVDPPDRPALAYLYNAQGGTIEVGPGQEHEPLILVALVKRLHPLGLLRGDPKKRSLTITAEGRRVVDHWICMTSCCLTDAGRDRVVDSLRWIGCPTLPVDAELERFQLVKLRAEGSRGPLHFIAYTWRTDLCVTIARSLTKAGA